MLFRSQLNDKDHYCKRAHGFSSSAAPIFGHAEELLGVLHGCVLRDLQAGFLQGAFDDDARSAGGRMIADLYGLPGQVTSAQIVMLVFGQPLLVHLGGDAGAFDPGRLVMRPAKLGANLSSKPGREDYVRVRLEEQDGQCVAMPRLGKSGLLRTMLDADGLVRLPASLEGMSAGQDVDVWIF